MEGAAEASATLEKLEKARSQSDFTLRTRETIEESHFLELIAALKANPALTSLILAGISMTKSFVLALAALLPSSTLETFIFQDKEANGDILSVIIEGAGRCRSLRVLGFEGAKSPADASRSAAVGHRLRDLLTLNPNLEDLRFSGFLSVEGAQALTQGLEQSSVSTLELDGCSLSDQSIALISEAMAKNMKRSLSNLNLDNSVGDQGALALSGSLASLKFLYLNDNEIGDVGAECLASALESNTSLDTLDLYRNKVGSRGAKALAGALTKNSTIRNLFLAENPIDEEGSKALASMLDHNTSLLSCYVEDTYQSWPDIVSKIECNKASNINDFQRIK